MKRKSKTPQQKKALSYAMDRRVNAEYPHGFRHNWPTAEARTKRNYRREVGQLLSGIEKGTASENIFELQANSIPVRLKIKRKWSSGLTLREHVDKSLRNRVNRTAWNFFKSNYNSSVQREAFTKFLNTLTEGRSKQSRRQAEYFNFLLLPHEVDPGKPSFDNFSRGNSWLTSFFHDEPALEEKLRTWIRLMLAKGKM